MLTNSVHQSVAGQRPVSFRRHLMQCTDTFPDQILPHRESSGSVLQSSARSHPSQWRIHSSATEWPALDFRRRRIPVQCPSWLMSLWIWDAGETSEALDTTQKRVTKQPRETRGQNKWYIKINTRILKNKYNSLFTTINWWFKWYESQFNARLE